MVKHRCTRAALENRAPPRRWKPRIISLIGNYFVGWILNCFARKFNLLDNYS